MLVDILEKILVNILVKMLVYIFKKGWTIFLFGKMLNVLSTSRIFVVLERYMNLELGGLYIFTSVRTFFWLLFHGRS
jgi:hypothetical protein